MELYIVRPGDSLSAIAKSCHTSPEALVRRNQLGDPRRLCPGLSLVLEGKAGAAPAVTELCAALSPQAEPELADTLLPNLSWLCVQGSRLTAQGGLNLPEQEQLLRLAHRHQAMPLLTVSNLGQGGFSPALAHTLVSHEEAGRALTDNILKALESQGCRGVDLSFQYLYPFDREAYSAFARRLGKALHSAGYYFFCSLAPKTQATAEAPLCAGQDYAALGAAADRLILLAHGWGGAFTAPQAIAPLDRVAAALDYAAALIPRGKLLLGLSWGGCAWVLPWRQGDAARPMSAALAVDTAVAAGAEIRYDAAAQAPFFLCPGAGGRRRIIWYEDSRSLLARLELARSRGLAGVSLWPQDRLYRPGLHMLQSRCAGEKLV